MLSEKNVLAVTGTTKQTVEDIDDNDEAGYEVRSTDDNDDAGSLVDFIVEDDGEGEEDEAPLSDVPLNNISNEMDGIDPSNIIEGKRIRKPRVTYEQEVFASSEYRKMMLEDVPDEEIEAIENSSEDDGTSDEDDDEYEHNSESDNEKYEDDENAESSEEEEEDGNLKKRKVANA